jgi:CheY-like chemotaxis protein
MQAAKTILLVDDDPLIRTLLTQQLSRQGFQVVGAANGVEALELAGLLPDIDLVVTDIIMPEIDGFRLAERLRASGRAPRILFISGSCDAKVLENHLGRSEVEFLAKPFTPAEFRSVVENMLALS